MSLGLSYLLYIVHYSSFNFIMTTTIPAILYFFKAAFAMGAQDQQRFAILTHELIRRLSNIDMEDAELKDILEDQSRNEKFWIYQG